MNAEEMSSRELWEEAIVLALHTGKLYERKFRVVGYRTRTGKWIWQVKG